MTKQYCLGCIITLLLFFSSSAPCRPCSDTEVLLAICTSDFGKSVPMIVFPGSEGFLKSALISFVCGGSCRGGSELLKFAEPGFTGSSALCTLR